jgi:hypothetical protein
MNLRKWMALTSLLLAASLPARAAPAVDVPLQLEGEGPWYRLNIPLNVQLAASHDDLRDLRVLNAEGEELAYSFNWSGDEPQDLISQARPGLFPLDGPADVQTAPAVQIKRGTSGSVIEIAPESPDRGKLIQRGWLVDASFYGKSLRAMTLDWSSGADGFQRFTIEASDDLQHWQSWGEGQIARLSYAGERVEQREVALPQRKAKYLRLIWQTPRQAPDLTEVMLTGVDSQVQMPALTWSEPMRLNPYKPGVYTLELPRPLLVQAVQLQLPPGNVLAPVMLYTRGAINAMTRDTIELTRKQEKYAGDLYDGPDSLGQNGTILSGERGKEKLWLPFGDGLLYRLPQDGKEALRDEIKTESAPVKEMLVRVDTRGGGLGSEPPEMRLAVRGAQVVFLARGSAPYKLVVGGETARSAALPLDVLIPNYEPKRLLTLGRASAPDVLPAAISVSPAVQSPGESAPGWKRFGLWAVLLLGVALLAAMAFSLLRNKS